MGTLARKEREKEQRRQAIIDAAERVFFSRGFDLATMDEIAGESELSKGTLYLYFKNKEELLMAINERGLGILARMLEEALEKGLTGRKMLRKTGEAYLEFAMKHNDYFRAMMYHEGQIVPEQLDSDVVESCVEKGNQCISCMIRAIQAGKMDGSIKIAIDSYQLAMLLWATLYGVIQLYTNKRALPVFKEIDLESFFRSYFTLLGEGLGK